MAQEKKVELWIVGDGKPPQRVDDVDKGLQELSRRGPDAVIKRVVDKSGGRAGKVRKEDKPKKEKGK